MRHINPAKTGLCVGIVICLWHFMWATLVAVGWAKAVIDFVLKLHFIQMQYELAPFAMGTAAMLVALTFCIGALLGILFAIVWNWLVAGKATGATNAGTSAAPA